MNDEQPREPRFWPAKWARQESFWRDVASQTLAGLILAVIAAVIAAVAGFIPWLRVLQWLIAIGGFVMLFLGATTFPFKARWPDWAWITYGFGMILVSGAGFIWIAATGGLH